jgi:hypothetical protein
MENREKRKESMSRDQAIGDMGGRIKLGLGKILNRHKAGLDGSTGL